MLELKTHEIIALNSSTFFFFIYFNRIFCLPDIRSLCKTVPNLSKTQLDLCYHMSDVTLAAVDGLELAVQECQYQVFFYYSNNDFARN